MHRPKRVFEITVAMPADSISDKRTWLVLADHAEEAERLIPPEYPIEKVETMPGTAIDKGPSRCIGWTIPHYA